MATPNSAVTNDDVRQEVIKAKKVMPSDSFQPFVRLLTVEAQDRSIRT